MASSLRTFSLHLALSKKRKKNRLIQCVHKPVRDGEEEGERERERERERIKNQTCRHESDDLFSLHLCICLRKPLLHA